MQLLPLVSLATPSLTASRVSRVPRVSHPGPLVRATLAPQSDRRNTLYPRSRANATTCLACFFVSHHLMLRKMICSLDLLRRVPRALNLTAYLFASVCFRLVCPLSASLGVIFFSFLLAPSRRS